MQTVWQHRGRYSDIFEFGYLDLVRRGRSRDGRVPEWLQQVLVYELSWYLAENDSPSSRLQVPPDLATTFRAHLAELLDALDPAVIGQHRVRRLHPVWIDVMAHAFRPEPWHSNVVTRTRRGPADGPPAADVPVRRAAPPTRRCSRRAGRSSRRGRSEPTTRTSGRVSIHERILWLPDRADVEVRLGGRSMRIRPEAPVRARRPETIRAQGRGHRPRAVSPRRLRAWRVANPHAARRRARAAAREDGRRRPLPRCVGRHGSDPRCRRQRRAAVRVPARRAAGRQRVVRPRGRHAGLAPPPAGRGHAASSRTGPARGGR